MIATTIQSDKEWEVIFNEGKHWRIGVYRPKFRRPAEITELEQHTCPESFLLIDGEIVILYKDEHGIMREKNLKPHELVTMSEPHAGYSPGLDGVALVVENAVFETQYTSVATGESTRHVVVPQATI